MPTFCLWNPETESEFAEIAHRLDAPLLANMVEGAWSPVLSQERLQELGYAVAIYPGKRAFSQAAAALKAVYAHVKNGSVCVMNGLYPIDDAQADGI